MQMITQVFIILFSGSAIWLVSRKGYWRRWGYITGLLAQPFWAYTTISHKQWGMLILCLWYGYSWAQDVWNYWIIPWIKDRKHTQKVMKLQPGSPEHERVIQTIMLEHGMTWIQAWNYYHHTILH